ncbi:MAG TPA: hypothetical protein VJ371_16520, partial [Streptosporangiaceae bacterium]|nr:hypothetical protein [Streptosporangiaceae bacterium]
MLVALLALGAQHLAAQEHPTTSRGFHPESTFSFSDLDHVNTYNGNLVVTLPIGSRYPVGAGFSYGLTLVYNSNLWEFQDASSGSQVMTQAIPSRHSNAGLGWRLSFGTLFPRNFPYELDPHGIYVGPDGGVHLLFPTLHVGDPADSGVSYTRDGTYLRVTALGNGSSTVESPDGVTQLFDANGEMVEMRDRLGNSVSVAYSPTAWTISDSQGRTQRVWLRPVPSNPLSPGDVPPPLDAIDHVDLTAWNGGTATYSFQYNPSSVTIPRQ